jgi:predicted RNA polymerase sigma factor
MRTSRACEDAVQEALVAAGQHWPKEGIPSNPRSWLVTAASRTVVDEWRSMRARRRREEAVAVERRKMSVAAQAECQ